MFYLQHGYGKSDKLAQCSAGGNIAGVILSPGNEDLQALKATVARAKDLGLRTLLDPQSYIYSLQPRGSFRHHNAHSLEFDNLSWSMPATQMSSVVDAVAAANKRLKIAKPWIAPGPIQRSFSDFWVPIGVQLTRTAGELWGDNVLATVVIDEAALSDIERANEWLDAVTTLEISGFYLVVSRSDPQYPAAPWAHERLANLMYVIHVLTEINQYQVLWGYADIDGLLGLAAGATGVASGWSYSLRQFRIERFCEVRTGGATATPRVYVSKLISAIRHNEANDIFNLAGRIDLFSEEMQSEFATRKFSTISNPEAQTRHLTGLAADVGEISQFADQADRLTWIEERIDKALTALAELEEAKVLLDPRYASRLVNYRDSVSAFRARVNL